MHKTFTLSSLFIKKNETKHQKLAFDEQLEPSEILVQNILNYSKSLAITKSRFVNYIEIVSN